MDHKFNIGTKMDAIAGYIINSVELWTRRLALKDFSKAKGRANINANKELERMDEFVSGIKILKNIPIAMRTTTKNQSLSTR